MIISKIILKNFYHHYSFVFFLVLFKVSDHIYCCEVCHVPVTWSREPTTQIFLDKDLTSKFDIVVVISALYLTYPLWRYKVNIPGEYVCPYTHKPPRKTAVTICNHQAAHFMYSLMSDLVICRFRKRMVIHDTECPY